MEPDAYMQEGYGVQSKETLGTEPRKHSNGIRTAIRWIVNIGVFFLPLWVLPFVTDTGEFSKQILLVCISGTGLVLYLVDVIKSGRFSYQSNPLYWPLLGIIAASIISVIFSVSRFTSVFGIGDNHANALVAICAMTVLFFLALNVMEDKGQMTKDALKLSCTIALAIGLLEALGVQLFPGSFGKPGFTTVGTLNVLTMLGAVLLPFFLSVGKNISGTRRAIGIAVNIIGFLSAFALLAISHWWVLWIVAFVGLLAHVAFNASIEMKKNKMSFFSIPLAVIIIGALLWVLNPDFTLIRSKLPIEIAPSHTASYNTAWRSIISKPLGYGLENFTIAYDKLRSRSSVNTSLFQLRFTEASSQIANIMVEGGVLMVLAGLFFLYACIRVFIRHVSGGFGGNSNAGNIWASLAALFVSFIFSPAVFTTMLLLMLLLALVFLAHDTNKATSKTYDLESKTMLSFAGSAAFVIGLALVIVTGYLTYTQLRANMLFARASSTADADNTAALYRQSFNSYSHDARVYRAMSQKLLTQIASALDQAQKSKALPADVAAKIQRQMADAVNASVQATVIDPADSENWMNRAFVYQNIIGLVSGVDQLAADMYKETLDRYPNNPLAYVRLGNMYLSIAGNLSITKSASKTAIDDNLKKAEDNFMQAITLYPNYGQALYNLAATYDREGKLPQAVKQFEKLTATQPRDPGILFQLGLLYYRNSQKDNALAAWERAVALFPDYSNARWYLSLIYEERGNLAKALDQVQQIQKFNKDNELVKQRIAQLEEGIRTIPPAKVLDPKHFNDGL